MVTPRISLVAWEDRQGGFIFVAVPDERGRYVRTDKSVALAACTHCGSQIGEPCRGGQGYGGGTHVVRRKSAGLGWGRPKIVDDVVRPEPVETTPAEWMEPAA